MIIVGVDPGGRTTGLAVRDTKLDTDQGYVTHQLVARTGNNLLPVWADRTWSTYAHNVLRSIDRLLADAAESDRGPVELAVETLHTPSGFAKGKPAPLNRNQLGGLMGTCGILVVVLARWPNAGIIAPGGHGSAGQIAYPPQIRKPEHVKVDVLRHCRSAWDVTHAYSSERRKEQRT